MSGISSSIGLISGIDTGQLIDDLIAIERRPIQVLEARAQAIDARRAAFLSISAQLLAVRNSVANFNKLSFFKRFRSTSSNEGVVAATASQSALPASLTLRVNSLVTNHALISRGFTDANTTPVGAGTLSIELGHGRVNRSTDLEALNGGAGVRRGVIRVTDRAGASADIDLRTALTIDDVLEALNSNTAIEVRAAVTGVSRGADGSVTYGDRIVIEDLSDGTGTLSVIDLNGGFAAEDLGIRGSSSAASLDGRDLVRLSMDTPLAMLNDGNGVGRVRRGDDLAFATTYGDFGVSLGDILEPELDLRALNSGRGVRLGTIRITDRAGETVEVDLSPLSAQGRVTVADVRDTIAQAASAAGVSITVNTVNSSFLIADSSTPARPDAALVVEDVSGFSAADLGITASEEDGSIIGRAVYRVATIGDVIRAINYASGNDSLVEAAISEDGDGIELRTLGFGNEVRVTSGSDTEAGTPSTAAADLGLLDATLRTNEPFTSRRLVAGLNTVLLSSLRGGAGVSAGRISVTDASGQTAEIDLSSARTLSDVIDLINADSATSIRAAVNSAGNGIELRDESAGTGPVVISDTTGSLATDLGIAGTHELGSGRAVNGGSAQLRYLTRHTLLSSLNAGQGVRLGTFQITDSNGIVHAIDPAQNLQTVGDVIDAINLATPDHIEARINDNGDGIVITDTAGGIKALTIQDVGGRTAADLRLAGAARAGQNFLDGSYEVHIEIGAADTLNDVARKINEAGAGVSAGVVNDGSQFSPFSLTVTSGVSGRRGELVFDVAGVDLGLRQLTRARDAVITLGGESSSRLVSSSTNRLENVLQGVTLDLLASSSEDVAIDVAQDVDAIIESLRTFVDSYNQTLDTIGEQTSFDSETFERGLLFGDPAIDVVRTRLHRTITRAFSTSDPTVSRLFNVGLRLGSGGRLEFNEEQFKEAYEENPQSVEALFTTEEAGFGAVIQGTLDELTRDFDGVLARKDQLLNEQQELINDRIDSMNILIEAKRARLEAQFVGLESALAALQAQQSALSVLSQSTR